MRTLLFRLVTKHKGKELFIIDTLVRIIIEPNKDVSKLVSCHERLVKKTFTQLENLCVVVD